MKPVRAFATFITISFAILFLWAASAPQAEAQLANNPTARWIHAQINEWRIGLDLAPLTLNDTLTRMALDQAAYVASLRHVPDNIHAGRNGEGPRVRALYDTYQWPTFGNAQQIVIGEITWIGTQEDAINFWHESAIHRQTATNAWYREVGVAAVPKRDGRGYVIVVVLGAEPGVLPAMADPERGVLYLTNERYPRGSNGFSAEQFRLFDQQGRMISDWQPWQPEIPLPTGSGSLYVLYANGDRQALTEASLNPANIPLPAYETAWQTALIMSMGPTATPAPTATPTPPPTPHIRLTYNRNLLTLVNTVNTNANVSRLVLASPDGTQRLAVREWNAGFIRGSLNALPQWNCVQAALLDKNVSTPTECRYSSLTLVLPTQALWRSDFVVLMNEVTVATCIADDGVCEFDLP